MLVTDWIARERRYSGRNVTYYVVCSEDCLARVDKALRIINADSHEQEFQLLLGVDEMRLSKDPIRVGT